MALSDSQGWREPSGDADMPSPWPELDEHLHLRPGHLIGIGALTGSREAEAGYDLALHTAAQGEHTLLYAPHLTPRNPVPNLEIRRRGLSPQSIEAVLEGRAGTSRPVSLVVIDHFALMQMDDDEPFHEPEQAADLGRRLKMLASCVPIVVMAQLTVDTDSDPLQHRHLGLAGELEYDADTLLLMHRTDSRSVEVLIAKDRHSYAPRKATITW
ncbi:DnaB-like helicase C-terminal domain-containing protein [Streptomyces sp. NPDC059008]|uniref:DnaB-like helicase C-terminal domain-containing protein n=1 Tax=Streptomyces sp. NPDC059008 TaxID=3346693 RepID=UPI0036C32484